MRRRVEHKDHVWSYDFLSYRTRDGRRLKLLAVIDEYTRECLAIDVTRSFTDQDMVGIMQYLFSTGSTPWHLRSGNGPEFVSQTVRRWLGQSNVKPLFIAKGSPGKNGYIESVGDKLRDELFSRELFFSQEEANWVIDRWRLDYNHHSIHSSLQYRTPTAFFGWLCSAGCGYAFASRTQPIPLTLILSLTLVQDGGDGSVVSNCMPKRGHSSGKCGLNGYSPVSSRGGTSWCGKACDRRRVSDRLGIAGRNIMQDTAQLALT